MGEKLKVGLLGFGTIGTGVIRLLTRKGIGISRWVELVKVADIDLDRPREVELDSSMLTADAEWRWHWSWARM